jgi:hypothetical protein
MEISVDVSIGENGKPRVVKEADHLRLWLGHINVDLTIAEGLRLASRFNELCANLYEERE